MQNGPRKWVEAIVGFFIPLACREEVLGDLYQRYQSEAQYAADACRTLPMVLYSRVRRTSDPQVVLIQTFLVYLCFLAAAWFLDRPLLDERWGLLRLACPVFVTVSTLVLVDVYGVRSALPIQSCSLAIGTAFISQTVLSYTAAEFMVPRLIMICGAAAALIASTGVRSTFQRPAPQAPGYWFLRDAQPAPFSRIRLLIMVGLAAAALVAGVWLTVRHLN